MCRGARTRVTKRPMLTRAAQVAGRAVCLAVSDDGRWAAVGTTEGALVRRCFVKVLSDA